MSRSITAKVLLVLVLGVLLGSGSVAASDGLWHKSGHSYSCEGGTGILQCQEARYRFVLLPRTLTVSYGDEVIFECARSRRPGSCQRYAASPEAWSR